MVFGQTILSKATGITGTLIGISGSKAVVSFDGRTNITVPLSSIIIDDNTLKLIEMEMKTVPVNKTNQIRKQSKQNDGPNNVVSGKIDLLDAKDRLQFFRINEVLNACFGTDYAAWMKGVWPLNETYWCWFPKLVRTLKDEPATNGCTNVISGDWNTLIYDEHKDTVADTSNDPHDDKSIVFAREPDNGPILFRGIYVYDREKSSYKHYVHRRIATRIRIIGNPAYDVELLDSIDINRKG